MMELMDGVILVEELKVFSDVGKTLFFILIFIVLFLSWLIGKLFEKWDESHEIITDKPTIAVLITAVIGFITTGVVVSSFMIPSGKYKVTLTDSVDTEEFQRRYKIINCEDDIYTIMESSLED